MIWSLVFVLGVIETEFMVFLFKVMELLHHQVVRGGTACKNKGPSHKVCRSQYTDFITD